MIDFIQGVLVSIEEESVVLNVNGIGYQVYVPIPMVYENLLNQECFIYTHHYFREDWMGLFGFKIKEERYLFRLLLSVSGIGPKGALAIIAQGNPNLVIEAIANEDDRALVKMPGVGKKTAQRIILDLKDKVKGLKLKGITSPTSAGEEIKRAETEDSDLVDALKTLGYSNHEIERVLYKLQDLVGKEPIDSLIKKALQLLMKE